MGEDDLIVKMTFMMTMDRLGIDAPADSFAVNFANAGCREKMHLM